MSPEKLYRVTYVGDEVVTLGRAGKFMPGTVALLDEEAARVAAARADFVVAELADEAPSMAPPASTPAVEVEQEPAPEPAPPEPAPAPVAPDRHTRAWRSERTQRDMRLIRWGHGGRAVLVLPPAGGDADAIEQHELVAALRPLLDAGKVSVYSVDDVAGRALAAREGDPGHRMWLLDRFHEYLALEVVPAMGSDGAALPAIAAGAGLGALHAAALLARWPDLFSHALCASGVFKLDAFLDGAPASDALRAASPLELVPRLADGPQLEALRGRLCVFALGEEDPAESQALAELLGAKGVPARVDPWGAAAGRDWPAWRAMIPKYLAEWT